MARFLIEVPHKENIDDCVKAVSLLLSTGSHFLTNADWGCVDGEHKAWVIVDLDSKAEARAILPPFYRSTAKITELNKFKMDEFDRIVSRHSDLKVS